MSNTSTTSRIAKNTFLLYVRSFIVMLISLYTSRIVLRVLGAEDLGVYNVVGGMVVLFAFLDGGQNATYQRFFNYAIGKPDKYPLASVFSTSIIVQLIISISVAIIAESFGLYLLNHHLVIPDGRMNAAIWVFHFSIITMIVNTLNIPYGAMIVAKEDLGAFAYIDIINIVLKLLLVFVVEFASFDRLVFYAFLVLLVQVLTRFIYTHYCIRHYRECVFHFVWNSQLLKEMSSFSIWIFLSSLCSVLLNQGLALLYNMFFGVIANAAIGIGNQVRSAVVKLTGNFAISFSPQLVTNYASGQFDKVYKIWTVGSKITFGLFAALAIPIIIDADFILSLWLENPPQYTTLFVRLILIENLIGALTPFSSTIIRASGRIKYFEIITNLINLFAIIIVFVCLKNGCSIGIPYLILICKTFVIVFYSIWRACGTIDFDIRKYILTNTFLCVLVLLVSSILGYYLKPVSFSLFSLILHLTAIFTLVFLSLYIIGCTSTERSYINNVIRVFIQNKWKK